MLNYKKLIKKILDKLEQVGFDMDNLRIDHLGYQASSSKEYSIQLQEFLKSGKLLSEQVVGGRRVAIIELYNPLEFKQDQIYIVEVIEPKPEQKVPSAWEHVEFLTDKTLEEIMETYPEVKWEAKAINREEFPMLILKLGEGLSAKFPRRGVLEELERLNSL